VCREDLLSSMLPVYRELLTHNLQILVYSGDVDAIVPVSQFIFSCRSNQTCMRQLCRANPLCVSAILLSW
jgi:hypothetical protein